MKSNRKSEIAQYVIQKEHVSLDELCSVFRISKNTVRRDVKELEETGVLQKVYGGVLATPQFSSRKMVSYMERADKNIAEKKRIGQSAARYVKDGDVIFIDSGTTTLNIVEHLSAKKNLTILTNNLYAINESAKHPDINTISMGGQLDQRTASFLSTHFFLDNLKQFNINKAFMAATGVSIEAGVTNTSPVEGEMKRNVVQKSELCFLLIDHSKFDNVALSTFAPLDRFQYVVTSKAPDKKYSDFFEKNGAKLIIE